MPHPPPWRPSRRGVLALTALAAVALLGVKGDVNLDGSIGVADVLVLQQALLQQATQGTLPLAAAQQDAADVSLVPSGTVIGNGVVDAGDLAILRSVVLGTGNGTDLAPDYAFALGLSPFSTDTNSNGINDGQDDPDGDGLSHRREQWLGLDPLNGDSDGDLILDGRDIAPVLSRSEATDLKKANEYLYTGTDPIQSGLTATIDPNRIAVLRGKVLSQVGAIVSGVTVRVQDHPEYGTTRTLSDGGFDLVVNGGGPLTLVFERAAYLTSRRTLQVPWQDYLTAADVRLLTTDPAGGGALTLSTSSVVQVWRGSVIQDALETGTGPRQPTLILQPGTTAQSVTAGQSPTPLPQVTIRATEATKDVKVKGANALPLALPPGVPPIYVADFSVMEAPVGSERIEFLNTDPQLQQRPVVLYLENFLNYPAGLVIENATLSDKKTAWVPDGEPGRIIQIKNIPPSGPADVDTDGNGTVDNIDLSVAEREQLAQLYADEQTLWRFPMKHFSYGCPHVDVALPASARVPDPPPPRAGAPDDPTTCTGCIIDLENQVLKESIDLAGMPWNLHYASERTPGFFAAYQVDIPVTGPPGTLPASLAEVRLKVEVAGQATLFPPYAPTPNQVQPVAWDGKTIYGQKPQGRQPIRAEITWWYPPLGIVGPGGSTITGLNTRGYGGRTQTWEGFIGPWDNRAQGLGGWTLSPVHAYDERSSTLYRGDGERLSAESLPSIITRLNETYPPPSGGPSLPQPASVAVAPDGIVYFGQFGAGAGTGRVGKLNANGSYTTVVGGSPTGGASCNPENPPPTAAQNACLASARDLAFGPDGALYIADESGNRVWKVTAPVSPTSLITKVAGSGSTAAGEPLGDGTLATSARV